MKLYIEDLMCRLDNTGQYLFTTPVCNVSSFDSSIVSNLATACETGRGLTQKQRTVSVKLCHRYRQQLISIFGQDAIDALNLEEFRLPLLAPYTPESSIKVENKKILVKFPYNEEIISNIKKYKVKIGGNRVNWNPNTKSWDFDLDETNLLWLKNNIVNDNFTLDPVFTENFEKISKIFDHIENYTPCLTYDGGEFVFKNTHPTVPQPETTDLKQALFYARLHGINTWDENVEKMIENEDFSPLLKSFLLKFEENIQEFDSNEIAIDQFTDLFRYNTPVLIVVPGGHELQSLRTWYFWLKSQNFEEKDISVMFRLDNGNNSAFNDIVKEYKLNNPIAENTKVVFISQKLPKPVIKSGINFKFVINLSATWSSHYSINSFIDTMTDVIRYAPIKKENKN